MIILNLYKIKEMYNLIKISNLNDFIFCPISLYFHNLYGNIEDRIYNEVVQENGKEAHKSVDYGTYSNKKDILTSIEVVNIELGLVGKIDIYDTNKKMLIERKRKVKKIYDGYVFQLYGQYYCLKEMGFDVEKLKIYSMVDNKSYDIDLPTENIEMDNKFKSTIENIKNFDMGAYRQTNVYKCEKCIYRLLCDKSLND